jgi:hypothetical protein
LAVGAGAGVAAWKIADAQAEADLATANAEIARLQGLVDLYEDLESVGLDALLAAGMSAAALPLQAVEAGARALQAGLEWIEQALASVEQALPTARESMLWLETQVTAVAEGLAGLETAVSRALDRAADNPVAAKLKEFGAVVLDNLPFGLGEKIRNVFDGLVQLVTSVDELVQGINTRLLEPLRSAWFSEASSEGIGASLIDPLVERIVQPLETHLADLAALADTWEQELVAPTKGALGARAEIRDQIAQYRNENRMLSS